MKYYALVVVGVLMCSLSPLLGQTNLQFGVAQNAQISAPGQVDLYLFTFSGSTDERVIVRMSEAGSSTFFCDLTVLDANDNIIGHDIAGQTAELILDGLTPGSYTIRAQESGGSLTGSYRIFLQRSRNPGNSIPAVFGQAQQDSIAVFGQLDTYVFNINEGLNQTVLVRMAELAGGPFFVNFWVFDPDGEQIGERISGITGELSFEVSKFGEYTIWAAENGGDFLGNYQLTIQKSLNPGNAQTVPFGESQNASMGMLGELDTYSFDITDGVGQSLIVRMSEVVGGPFFCQIQVYDPDGLLVANRISGIVAELVFIPSKLGRYTVWAMDSGGDNIADYTLQVQKSFQPGNALPLSFGEFVQDSLRAIGDLRTYQFELNAAPGQSAIVRMADLAGTAFFCEYRIFDPNGEEIAQRIAGSAIEAIFEPQLSGNYTVWAMESGGENTGPYGIIVQRSANPGNATELSSGSSIVDTLSSFGDLHTYTFQYGGSPAKVAMIVMEDLTGGPFFSRIILFDPSGVELAEAINGSIASINVLLPDPGEYTIWAMESGGDNTGDYRLTLDLPVGIGETDETTAVPVIFSLEQNYPNPFNPTTQIPFALPQSELVTLNVINVNGQIVRKLVNAKTYQVGEHQVVWDGKNDAGEEVASGLYFYTLRAGEFLNSKRMILLR